MADKTSKNPNVSTSLDSLLTKQVPKFQLVCQEKQVWSYTRFLWHRMTYDLFLLSFKSVLLSSLLKVISVFCLLTSDPLTYLFWSAFKASKSNIPSFLGTEVRKKMLTQNCHSYQHGTLIISWGISLGNQGSGCVCWYKILSRGRWTNNKAVIDVPETIFYPYKIKIMPNLLKHDLTIILYFKECIRNKQSYNLRTWSNKLL